jgi:hypothetical protein
MTILNTKRLIAKIKHLEATEGLSAEGAFKRIKAEEEAKAAKQAKLAAKAAKKAELDHVWATVEIRHAGHGWPAALKAWLISDQLTRRDPCGSVFRWVLQGETAGISVDRALGSAVFRSVPTALWWIGKVKFARNVKMLREWKDAREFYFEGRKLSGDQ